MTNQLFEFAITLKLRGPVLTRSTSPATFGLDAAVARDFVTGVPSIPGTLLKGKLREALGQLGTDEKQLASWFGRGSPSGGDNEPERGAVICGDLCADRMGHAGVTIDRIAHDSLLGSARGEMLRVIEAPFRPGEEVIFSGTAHAYVSAAEAVAIEQAWILGLKWLTQVGALRTTGFGRVLDATVARRQVAAKPAAIDGKPAALALEIRPLGPFCISRHRIGDNLFESDDVIPGNVLAGAIKRTADLLGVDIPDFDHIRFRHAFPTTGRDRPRALPVSTVKAGKKAYDVALLRGPVRLSNESGEYVAPAFPVDWKSDSEERGLLGWAAPARELRVRTKIDGEKRTADRGTDAAAGGLFAVEMVHPRLGDRKTFVVWRTRIDLGGTTDAGASAQALASVLCRLGYVGKTKARCEVNVAPVGAADAVESVASPLVLTLQTPALLADPRFPGTGNGAKSGALAADVMLQEYRAVWDALSGGALRLRHHFARQRLAGGEHLWRRFQGQKAYDPFLLTEAGSVFVFDVVDGEQAKTQLQSWLAAGLPVPEGLKQRFGDDWRRNPYRPENGFGEVAVHATPFASAAPEEIRPVWVADPILPAEEEP